MSAFPMTALFPHAETTHGVTIRVAVTLNPDKCEPEHGRWFWTYHVRIENGRDAPVKLLTRRWIVADGRGALYRREGEGVVGEQPVIKPGASFDYVSGNQLPTPTGWMEGSYVMLDGAGSLLEVRIPRFALVAGAVSG
jgi:ApaG protein